MYSAPRYGEWAGRGSGGTPGARPGPSVPPSSPPHTPPRTGAPSVSAVTRVASLNSDQFRNQCVKFFTSKGQAPLGIRQSVRFWSRGLRVRGNPKKSAYGRNTSAPSLERDLFLYWIPWPKWCSLQPSTYHKLPKFDTQWRGGGGVNILEIQSNVPTDPTWTPWSR